MNKNNKWYRLFNLLLGIGLLLSLWVGLSQKVMANELPVKINISDVKNISQTTMMSVTFKKLYPELKTDKNKMQSLLDVINNAGLGREEHFDIVPAQSPFLTSVIIELKNKQSLIITLFNSKAIFSMRFEGEKCLGRRISNAKKSQEFIKLLEKSFSLTKGITLNSRIFRMGDQVIVSTDQADIEGETEANILLMPSYQPVTIPSAPAPYPVPEAILLGKVPIKYGQFSYKFKLQEAMGKLMNGKTGQISPGEWQLVVGGSFLPITILPHQIPQPKVVIYDHGRILTWNKQEGTKIVKYISPSEQPILISNPKISSPITHVSLNFLLKYLGVEVKMLSPDKYQLSNPGINISVQVYKDVAQINSTMFQLGGVLERYDRTVMLPWEDIQKFFGYKMQWTGAQQAVFLCNLDKIPDQLRPKIKANKAFDSQVIPVTVKVGAKKIDFGTLHAYWDSECREVIVPLRGTALALGGKMNWMQFDNNAYNMLPIAREVKSLAEVHIGDRYWRIYLTPDENKSITVPLGKLAFALGYNLTWNDANTEVTLNH